MRVKATKRETPFPPCFPLILLFALFISACGRIQPAPTLQITSTSISQPTATIPITSTPGSWSDKEHPAIVLARIGNGIPADLELSPDGKIIAVAGNLGVSFFDLETLEQVMRLPTQAEATSLAWSPRGDRIAAGTREGTVIFWDARTGEHLRVLRGERTNVFDVAWSPDGHTLASASVHTILLWDTDTSELLYTLDGRVATENLAWAPDISQSPVLASGANLWDGSSGEKLRSLGGDVGLVHCVTWSPDGRTLALGTTHGELIVWDTQTGERLLEQKYEYSVTSLAWSPDGTLLAWAQQDGKIVVWSMEKGERLRVLLGPGSGMMGEVYGLAWAPDSRILVAGSMSEMLIVWDAMTGKELRRLGGSNGLMSDIAWSPEGDKLASVSTGGELILWDARTGEQLSSFGEELGWLSSVAWSPDGRYLASGGDSSVTIWDASTGQQFDKLWGHVHSVYTLAWSPGGRFLASVSEGVAFVWDVSTGERQATLQDYPRYGAENLVWSPDGGQFATSWREPDSIESGIAVWDARRGELLRIMVGHAKSVEGVAWSPDGKVLASAGLDKVVILWDANTGEQLGILTWDIDTTTELAWSPNGEYLAMGGIHGSVRLWDPSKGEEVRRLAGHKDMVDKLAWSPSGDMLASSSTDGTLIVCEMGP